MIFDKAVHRELVLKFIESIEIKGTMQQCEAMISDLKDLQKSAEAATIEEKKEASN